MSEVLLAPVEEHDSAEARATAACAAPALDALQASLSGLSLRAARPASFFGGALLRHLLRPSPKAHAHAVRVYEEARMGAATPLPRRGRRARLLAARPPPAVAAAAGGGGGGGNGADQIERFAVRLRRLVCAENLDAVLLLADGGSGATAELLRHLPLPVYQLPRAFGGESPAPWKRDGASQLAALVLGASGAALLGDTSAESTMLRAMMRAFRPRPSWLLPVEPPKKRATRSLGLLGGLLGGEEQAAATPADAPQASSSSCWLHDGAPPQPAAASWFLEAGAEGPRCATARLAALKPSVNGEAVVTQAALQANATNAALRGQMEALFSLMQARPEELAPDAEEAAEAARLDARAALEKLLGRAQRGALRVER